MREALTVIAEVKDSQRLRDFLATGRDSTCISLSQRVPALTICLTKLRICHLRTRWTCHGDSISSEIRAISTPYCRLIPTFLFVTSANCPQKYFYTIKDLRTVISALPNNGGKWDESKFTDDDLKRHRVGGRLVTRREIQRSKRCE